MVDFPFFSNSKYRYMREFNFCTQLYLCSVLLGTICNTERTLLKDIVFQQYIIVSNGPPRTPEQPASSAPSNQADDLSCIAVGYRFTHL